MVAKSELRDALTAALPDFSQDPGRMNLPNLPAMPCFGLGSPAPCRIFRLWFFARCFTGRLDSHRFFLPTVWAVAAWEWHRQGWRMDEEHLVVQRGIMLLRHPDYASSQGPSAPFASRSLMRWYGVFACAFLVADSVVALPVLEDSEAQRLFDRLSEGTFAAKTG